MTPGHNTLIPHHITKTNTFPLQLHTNTTNTNTTPQEHATTPTPTPFHTKSKPPPPPLHQHITSPKTLCEYRTYGTSPRTITLYTPPTRTSHHTTPTPPPDCPEKKTQVFEACGDEGEKGRQMLLFSATMPPWVDKVKTKKKWKHGTEASVRCSSPSGININSKSFILSRGTMVNRTKYCE